MGRCRRGPPRGARRASHRPAGETSRAARPIRSALNALWTSGRFSDTRATTPPGPVRSTCRISLTRSWSARACTRSSCAWRPGASPCARCWCAETSSGSAHEPTRSQPSSSAASDAGRDQRALDATSTSLGSDRARRAASRLLALVWSEATPTGMPSSSARKGAVRQCVRRTVYTRVPRDLARLVAPVTPLGRVRCRTTLV